MVKNGWLMLQVSHEPFEMEGRGTSVPHCVAVHKSILTMVLVDFS